MRTEYIKEMKVNKQVKKKNQRQNTSVASPENNEHANTQTRTTGLSPALIKDIKSLSGFDLSGIKLHLNSEEPAKLNAKAYAQNRDIHVAPGQETSIPHEVWHIVQQMQGRVKARKQKDSQAINDDSELEQEADTMGDQIEKGLVPEEEADEPDSVNSLNAPKQLSRHEFKKEVPGKEEDLDEEQKKYNKVARESREKAIILDRTINSAADKVNNYVKSFMFRKDKKLPSAIDASGVNPKNWSTFVRRLKQFEMGFYSSNLASTAAGYVIEDIANEKAKEIGVQTQYRTGRGRPDFAYESDEKVDDMTLRGIMDCTSDRQVGHIEDKFSQEERKYFAYVAELSYPAINFKGGKRVKQRYSQRELTRMALKVRKRSKKYDDDYIDPFFKPRGIQKNRRLMKRKAAKRK